MEEGTQRGARKARLIAVVALSVALIAVGKATGIVDQINVESLRAYVGGAGALGIVVYIAAFAAGQLLHVPGMIFVGAGILAYGKAIGFGVALAGAIMAVSLSFIVVRSIGGRALADVERPFVRKVMARLDARPITTVLLLRTFLWLNPGLSYGLALSNIRLRDFVIGSALGLVGPILMVTVLFEVVFTWLFA
jgi:uncharacterized membrane protein YdjX (TVP38/TMEM64 family)